MQKFFNESKAKKDETNKKLDNIALKLNKLDQIEQRLNHLEGSMMTLGVRVSDVEQKNRELEESVSFVSNKFDSEKQNLEKLSIDMKDKIRTQEKTIMEANEVLQKVKTERAEKDKVTNEIIQTVTRTKTDLKRHERTIDTLSRSLESVRRDRDTLQEKVVDLQCRSMKMNLVFTGLGKEPPREETEAKLRQFLKIELDINDDFPLANVHRFGRFYRWKPRPIVARFVYQRDLDLVLDNAYQLKGSPFGVRQQFPAAIEDRRRELYPVLRHYRAEGANVKLARDRLYIDGKLYEPDDESDVEPDQNPDGDDSEQQPMDSVHTDQTG